jgi:hypothetical protein
MVREIRTLDEAVSGYILNLYGGPTGRIGNTIHPWNCPHLQTMTIPPRKIWADSIDELRAWLTEQGGELDPSSPTCNYVNA